MSKKSDEELFAAWREGDKRAGDQLIRRYLESMRRYFRNKLGGQDDENDLIQQVFEGCTKATASFRGDATFRTFLFQVAKNKLRDYFRARHRRKETVDIDEHSVADLSPGLSTMQSRSRRVTLLVEGLRRIPLSDQELLELRYWEKLTVPELSKILDMPEPAVKSRLRRAKERLKEAMAKLAENDEELRMVRTGELDRWADDVRKQQFERRREGGDGSDEDDDGDERA